MASTELNQKNNGVNRVHRKYSSVNGRQLEKKAVLTAFNLEKSWGNFQCCTRKKPVFFLLIYRQKKQADFSRRYPGKKRCPFFPLLYSQNLNAWSSQSKSVETSYSVWKGTTMLQNTRIGKSKANETLQEFKLSEHLQDSNQDIESLKKSNFV